ncbi:MAG TPA: hypothetical protein VNT02_01660, partial [Burkholderiales bacterium]|nr:hypothetical protein [Burkholderiales bacterium]
MSGLCGWFDPRGRNAQVLEAMSAALTRFDGSRFRSVSAAFGAAGAAALSGDVDVCARGDVLAVVLGRAVYTSRALAELAQREGVARALVEGYGRS